MATTDILISRSSELEQLNTYLSASLNAQEIHYILIAGDSGTGKSTLIKHFLTKARKQHPELLIAGGQCVGNSKDSGLVPFEQIFADLQKQVTRTSLFTSEALERIVPSWLSALPFPLGLAGPIVETAIELGHQLKPKYSVENKFLQFTNLLKTLADRNPVLFFIEDLHFCDESSLDLLFFISKEVEGRPLCFVGTYRPVEGLETGNNAARFRTLRADLKARGAHEIELIEGIDVNLYAKARFKNHRLPDTFLQSIQSATDGHPLFVDELFSYWLDNGTLFSYSGPGGIPEWRIRRGSELSIQLPDSVGEALEARLHLLRSTREQYWQELIRASVQGSDFVAQVIIDLIRLEEDRFYSDLKDLEDRYRLISVRGTQSLSDYQVDLYSFAHHYYREHIYNQLNHGQKRTFHRQTAKTLEEIYKDNWAIAGQLAHHYQIADDSLKSALSAFHAAQYEQSRYAWIEALQWCKFGMARLAELNAKQKEQDDVKELHLDLYELAAQSHRGNGDESSALKTLDDAIQLAKSKDATRERLARLFAISAEVSDSVNDMDPDVIWQHIQAGQALFDNETRVGSEAYLYLKLMECFMLLWISRDGAEKSLAMLPEVTEGLSELPITPSVSYLRGMTFNAISLASRYLDKYNESFLAINDGITEFLRSGDLGSASILLGNKADLLFVLGDLDEAEKNAAAALDLAIKSGNRDSEAYSLYQIGTVVLEKGDPSKAITLFTQCLKLSGPGHTVSVFYYADLARAYLATGHINLAKDYLNKAIQQSNYSAAMSYNLRIAARIELADGNINAAKEKFLEALKFAEDDGTSSHIADCKKDIGSALIESGEYQEARNFLEDALTIYESIDRSRDISTLTHLLASLDDHPRKKIN